MEIFNRMNTKTKILTRSERLQAIRKGGNGRRTAEIAAVNREARTVEISFSSEAEVERTYGVEVLSHDPGAVDLSRLLNSGAVLDNHDWHEQRGVVTEAWIDQATRKGRAIVKISRSQDGEDLLADIEDGIRCNVSVGYFVNAVEFLERPGAHRHDVYVVTKWQPYEISFVSVPADVTVGVGRKAKIPPMGKSSSRRDTVGIGRSADISTVALDTRKADPKRTNIGEQNSMAVRSINKQSSDSTFCVAIENAMRAQKFLEHTPVGFQEPTGYIPQPMQRSAIVRLNEQRVAIGEFERSPGGLALTEKFSGRQIPMKHAVAFASRVCRAGAQLIAYSQIGESIVAGAGDMAIAVAPMPAHFRRPLPAQFVTVPDDTDVAVTPTPIQIIDFDFKNNSIQKAVSFELKRRDLHKVPYERIEQEILESVTLGIGRVADEVVIGAVAAGAPANFSLGAAAAALISADDLRGIVGTGGVGATMAPDGTLRANGIVADLASAHAGTFIGDFSRAGLVINDEFEITFQRTGMKGNLAVTVFVNVLPVVMHPGSFFAAVA
ncbi:hypothetical protein [Solilutibacter silvestris]|uniref:Caudovirus prohead protease n=1 Tax=Solilutibacter silvestris TaxID=1645665 RepID=A0A2K1Q3K7_9GAMM|nr:hypothetical protein [Lysobacter silvestris]PNS09581.1 Caudovirus prohead protease [Lysobacter silvestris]